jgi:hypothetical protein
MTPVERMLAGVSDAKPSGNGWSARCPAHDDGNPSLSINTGDDGRALVKCHAGCKSDDVLAALGLTMVDLMPTAATLPKPNKTQLNGKGKPIGGANGKPRTVVTRAEIVQVLDACPDHHWRAIVALSRYGGLRCPSEVLSLRWNDIDWKASRIVVASPKTEHHAGKGSRTIPLFPELRTILGEALYLASDGAEYVVDERFRKPAMGPGGWMNANLRTHFERIVKRAGLTPWPRLFQNLRASRETELVEAYPVQVVASWLGNTPSVAMRHYLMTTDEHFASAVKGDESEAEGVTGEAAHKAAQRAHAGHRGDSQTPKPAHKKTPVVLGLASSSELTQLPGMAGAGFEPTTSRL